MVCGILVLSFLTVSQEAGLRKSFSDEKTGQTYNSFRSDSTEVLFCQVLVQDEFLYDQPKNNAEAIYTLDSDTFVEIAQETGGSFVNIKVLDKYYGIVEGWIRSGSLKKQRYFGKPFSEFAKLPKSNDADLKINPHWIKSISATVYSDSAASTPNAVLKTGDIVYIKDFYPGEINSVYFKNNGNDLSFGYIQKENLSELALIDQASSDFENLYKIYNPILLRNDLEKAGFISYKGISFKNKDISEFTEDKVCKEISTDTLNYRCSLSSNTNDIKKRTEIRNREERPFISMYRFLPDEKILTSRDTVKCKVLEIVSVPRSAKISVDGIEESTVSNMITKLYINTLEKFGMSVVFQRETEEYTYRYKKEISSGRIFDTVTDTERTIKRLVAFRKH